MSLKRKISPVTSLEEAHDSDIFRSSPIEDRSSTFIGFYSPNLKPKDLQNQAEFKSASHKILAWRRESNQQSITKSKRYTTGSDDDGEKYGGKRVERVLDSTQVEGACVVARWYGGVMLGPVRFDHIETCAREAVRIWQDSQQEVLRKRQRIEQDVAEHAELVKILAERDQSIGVLRQLALEKESLVKQAEEGSQASTARIQTVQAESTGTVDYSTMPLERLKILEKARDATLSFLLNRIDRAEADLKSAETNGHNPL